MHIDGTPHLGCHLGKQFLCVFTVLQPTLASQVAISENIFDASLWYSSLHCPLRLSSWNAELMHICGTPANFSYTGYPLGKQLLCIFTVLQRTLPTQAAILESRFRWPLEAYFELSWALMPEWLSDDLWRLVSNCSWRWDQNCSQIASGGSF